MLENKFIKLLFYSVTLFILTNCGPEKPSIPILLGKWKPVNDTNKIAFSYLELYLGHRFKYRKNEKTIHGKYTEGIASITFMPYADDELSCPSCSKDELEVPIIKYPYTDSLGNEYIILNHNDAIVGVLDTPKWKVVYKRE